MFANPDPHKPASSGRAVVVGAGATGALAAVRLAEAGWKVVIIEKAKPGNGSSSRSAACIRAQFGVKDTVVGMMFSEHWYSRFYDELEIPQAERDIPVLEQNGYLYLHEQPDLRELWKVGERRRIQLAWKKALDQVEVQRKVGLPVEVLSGDDVQRRWPHINGDMLKGATFCQNDGFLRHDLIYTFGLQRARQLNVELMVDTEVVGAVVRGGNIVQLMTSKATIECDLVVNATNAWGPR